MKKLVTAIVEFEKNDRVFSAGEILKGFLIVDSLVEISNLLITLNGETKINWHDAIGKNSDSQIHICTTQNFLRIFEKNRKKNVRKTKIPFKFDLPSDLPSSLESKIGSTRFCCIVQIQAQDPDGAKINAAGAKINPGGTQINPGDAKINPRGAQRALDTFEFPFTILGKFSGKIQLFQFQIEPLVEKKKVFETF